MEKESEWDLQSMQRFQAFSQGIPRIIWQYLRPTTISSMFSGSLDKSIWVEAFHRMVPHLLVEPSTLKVQID